jgi:sporulation and cell division protein SsgA
MSQQPTAPAVTQEIALGCEDELGRPLTFVSSFGYDPSDPYAVWLTFHIPGGDVHWVMARSLLAMGIDEPTGEGDVCLWPNLDADGRAVVSMDFHSPEGRLVVEARTKDVYQFLARSWAVVPPGAEGDNVDLDELVEELLAG